MASIRSPSFIKTVVPVGGAGAFAREPGVCPFSKSTVVSRFNALFVSWRFVMQLHGSVRMVLAAPPIWQVPSPGSKAGTGVWSVHWQNVAGAGGTTGSMVLGTSASAVFSACAVGAATVCRVWCRFWFWWADSWLR